MRTNNRKYVLLVLLFASLNLSACATNSRVNQVEAQSVAATKSVEQLKIDLLQNNLDRKEVEKQIKELKSSSSDSSERLMNLQGDLNNLNIEHKNLVGSIGVMQEGIKQNSTEITAVKQQETKRKKIVKEHDAKWNKISKETADKIKKLKEERAATDNGKL